MKLSSLFENEKQYEAQIEIISRGNSRKGSFSTKQVRKRIQNLGYDIKGAFPDKPDNQIIQLVHEMKLLNLEQKLQGHYEFYLTIQSQ